MLDSFLIFMAIMSPALLLWVSFGAQPFLASLVWMMAGVGLIIAGVMLFAAGGFAGVCGMLFMLLGAFVLYIQARQLMRRGPRPEAA